MRYPSEAIFYLNSISKADVSNRGEKNCYSSVKSEPNRSKPVSCFSQCQYPWNGFLDKVLRLQHQSQNKKLRILLKFIQLILKNLFMKYVKHINKRYALHNHPFPSLLLCLHSRPLSKSTGGHI